MMHNGCILRDMKNGTKKEELAKKAVNQLSKFVVSSSSSSSSSSSLRTD